MAHKENNTNQNPKDDAENQDSGQPKPINESSGEEDEVNPFKLFPIAKGLSDAIEKPKDDEDPFNGVEIEFISKRAFLSFIRATIKAKQGGFLGFIEDIQAQKKQGWFFKCSKSEKRFYEKHPQQ